MKVLQIYKTYYPDTFGGVEAVIKTLTHETSQLRAQQSLLTVGSSMGQDLIERLPVTRYHKSFEIASCPFSLGFFKNFKHIAQHFDLLHFHYPWPFADFTDLLRRVDRPALVTFHADALKHKILKMAYQPFQKAFFKRVNAIVATSQPLLESSADLVAFHDKCHVIPLAIDQQAYPTVSRDKLTHWQNKLGPNFALFVGVLRHYKGLSCLIEAAAHVNIPIVIAGGGPLAESLATQAKNANINNVIFLGRISNEDKSALYQLCSMVILPSNNRAEAFGVTLLEGLMYQKPLISTELGTGTSYVNQHNKTGFVVPPDQPLALVDAIQQLQNPNLANKMGIAGYNWFMEEFQSAIMGQRYIDLYQTILK